MLGGSAHRLEEAFRLAQKGGLDIPHGSAKGGDAVLRRVLAAVPF